MSAALNVTALCKNFATGLPAVDNVNFRAAAGEIVVLLGPSGCGKTTTLRCVAGLEHPTSGRIDIGDRTVSAPQENILVSPRHREVGMVFQSYAVWPHMTVRQNVAFPLRHRRLARTEIDRRVKDALELVGLEAYADRSAVALSGGQMQRVALARSLSYSPKILLLDEPLSNLDAKLRIRLRDDLRRIIKQIGVTALYVTHDQAEAVVLGDRIGVMNHGKLLQMGPPTEIYNRPVDLFVANFTGASNMLDGRVVDLHHEYCLVEMANGQHLQATAPQSCQSGDLVTVAIRPENIIIGARAEDEKNVLTARVVRQQYQGTQTAYTLDALGGHLDAIRLGTGLQIADGEETSLHLPRNLCWAYRRERQQSMHQDAA